MLVYLNLNVLLIAAFASYWVIVYVVHVTPNLLITLIFGRKFYNTPDENARQNGVFSSQVANNTHEPYTMRLVSRSVFIQYGGYDFNNQFNC